MRMKQLLGCVLCIVGMSGMANAGVINFEDLVVPVGFNTNGDVVSGGFLFDSPVNHSHLYISGEPLAVTENGTNFYVADDFVGNNPITMTKVGGGTFSLNQLDYAEFLQDNRVSASLTITGNLFGGGAVMKTVTLDFVRDGLGGVNDFQTTTFDGTWTNLTSVVFKGSGSGDGDDYFSLDNIVVDQAQVPEPSSLMLLGMGVTGLCGYRIRRKRHQAA